MSHLLEESPSPPAKANELLQGLTNAARNNPLPAALLGMGLIWVFGHDIAARVGAGGKAIVANKMRTQSFGPGRDEIASAQEATGEKAILSARSAQNRFNDFMEDQPFVVGAVGLAIGAGIAVLFPTTPGEKELLAAQAERLATTAKRLIAEKNA